MTLKTVDPSHLLQPTYLALILQLLTFSSFITLHSERDMIEEEWRYFAPGGAITPGGPSTWFILDWDQRRVITVTMDEEQESEDLAVEYLKKHIATLGDDVYGIHVSQDGNLLSVSTDPEDDQTTCAYYPPLKAIQSHDHGQDCAPVESTRTGWVGPECRPCFVYALPQRSKPQKGCLQVLLPLPVHPQEVA